MNFQYSSIEMLASRLKAGDQDAFTQLYHIYKDKIFAFAMRFLGSKEVAKEVVQEVFVKLWDARESVDPERSFNGYLYRIARNKILDEIEKYRREVGLDTVNLTREVVASVEDKIFSEEARKLETDVVANFPKQRQEVYNLRRYEGLSYDEIAERLGISKNTVKTHLKLAMKEMKDRFTPYTDLNYLFIIAMLLQH